jgi:hypothetical protein
LKRASPLKPEISGITNDRTTAALVGKYMHVPESSSEIERLAIQIPVVDTASTNGKIISRAGTIGCQIIEMRPVDTTLSCIIESARGVLQAYSKAIKVPEYSIGATKCSPPTPP